MKRLKKVNGSTPGERRLSAVADDAFFGLWSYACVMRNVGGAARAVGKEVADLLVFFDNSLILFSEKDIAFQDRGQPAVAWQRWYARSIEASAAQLHGAEDYIRRFPERLYLDQACTDAFPFSLSEPGLRFHLVAVCRNSLSAARAHFGTTPYSRLSSLSFDRDLSSTARRTTPFVVGDFDSKKTFVHVFDEDALDLLMSNLDCAADFLHYIRMRERAIRDEGLTRFDAEEDLLGRYLSFGDACDGFGAYRLPPGTESGQPHCLKRGIWINFIGTEAGSCHRAQLATAQTWKRLVRGFDNAIVSATIAEGRDFALTAHERALRVAAGANVLTRAHLADLVMSLLATVPRKIRNARLVLVGRTAYILLVVPRHAEHDDYDDYRIHRAAVMGEYGMVARHLCNDVDNVLIVGFDSRDSAMTSQTIMLFDGRIPLTPSERSLAIEIMVTRNVLNKLRPTDSKLVDAAALFKAGRNEACPCGSGLKFKRCHA